MAFARPPGLLLLTAAMLFAGILPWLTVLGILQPGHGHLRLLGLLTALVFVAGLSCFLGMRLYCRKILKARQLQPPLGGLEHWLYTTTFRLALRRQINPPRIAIYPSREFNAFALGLHRQRATIVLSEGLVHGLRPDELESVLAHEISHIANGDVQILAVLQGVLGVFIHFPARFLDYLVCCCWPAYNAWGPVYNWSVMLLQLAGGWLPSLLIMHFSRRYEYRADRDAAHLVGVKKMRAALRCLVVMTASTQTRQLAAFGLSARLRFRFMQLFNSHPLLFERLRALRDQA